MERSCWVGTMGVRQGVTQVIAISLIIYGAWVDFTPTLAWGTGVLLSQPRVVETLENKETFPESRFGSPPSRLDSEGKSRFVSNAIEDIRRGDAGESPGSGEGLVSNRRPAGLEFTQETGRAGIVQAQPVIGEPGMPQSPAN